MNRAEEPGGISLQVVENTGAAGDVILLHRLFSTWRRGTTAMPRAFF
jgi:hypothetical protein